MKYMAHLSDTEGAVQAHYGRGGLLARIDAAMAAAGIDPRKPRFEDLWPYDQLHGRGIAATREHADRSAVRSGVQVLDLGCGIGGSSRYLASLGCRVTGIDLTPEFIEVARTLTERCGLAGQCDFRVANALELPFADSSFDHVWSHNVTMNIADKARLAAEVARVLKPGGHFSLVEVAAGPSGEPTFPVPWANEALSSFLVTPAEMRRAIESAGLRVLKQEDDTADSVTYAQEMAARLKRGEQPAQFNTVTMGEDFAARARNMSAALREGKAVDQFILADKA